MGAETFMNIVTAESAREAFKTAHETACYEHGHGGYTGTIAEKSNYSMSKKPEGMDANEWLDKVEDFDEDEKDQEHYRALKHDFNIYDDKWGPALCIDCGPAEEGSSKKKYVLCGWASS